VAGAGGLGARIRSVVTRRRFLQNSFLLSILASGHRAFAQASRARRYRPLARPVIVPLADLASPGRVHQFVAEAATLASAASPNQPIRIAGMVARTSPDAFAAVCVRCPHELCDVDFVADPATLAQEIVAEIGHPMAEPVYVCPCHNSTFKMEDGERLAGPAPRGLYRFRVTNVTEAAVEIGEVEEDLLLFV
jgi:Rieske Fe-S protein